MMKPIQTEIRFADLLALVKTQEVVYYICHNVAYMLKDKLAENSDFNERFAEIATTVKNNGMPELVNSGCYYYIYDNSEDCMDFCYPVVAQLNAYIRKIFPNDDNVNTLPQHKLSDYFLHLVLPNSQEMYNNEFNFKSRVALLELIIEYDPEAVISIKL